MTTPLDRYLTASVRDATHEDSWDTHRSNPLKRFLTAVIRDALREESWDIRRWRQRLAVIETCRFIEAELPLATSLSNYADLVQFAAQMCRRGPGGMVCEFGVGSGNTINSIAKLFPDHRVYGFDAFEGLPESWRDGYPRGTFRVNELPKVLPNVQLVRGWFRDTIAPFLRQTSEPVVFVHIDCDLYSSAKTVLDALVDHLAAGSVILFDEFFNYPGWKFGEYRAWSEFVAATGIEFEYLAYAARSRQMVVRITRPTSSGRRPMDTA